MARLAQGKASRTARMTAALRHRHHLAGIRPLVFDDIYAGLFVDARSALMAVPTPVGDWLFGSVLGPVRGLEGEVLARSRYVEDVLEAKLADGLMQVIVLGAGFDTTGLRHAAKGLRIFEVDHPATQTEKRAILSRHAELAKDIVFVPVDFAKDNLVSALDAAGIDPAQPALVSWLGVTMYLAEQTVLATLAQLRTRLSPGSEVIFDAYPHPNNAPANERALFALTRAATASQGEPMTGWFNATTFPALVVGTGWRLTEMINGSEMRARWFKGQPKIILPPVGAVFCRLAVA